MIIEASMNQLFVSVSITTSRAGTFGCMVEYGAEHRVSKHSVVAAHVNIGVPLGVNVKLR